MLERKFGRRQFLQFLGLTGAGIALGECKAEVSQTAQPTETPLPTKLPTKTVSRIPTQTLVPKPTASPSPEPTVAIVVTPESKQPETVTPGDF